MLLLMAAVLLSFVLMSQKSLYKLSGADSHQACNTEQLILGRLTISAAVFIYTQQFWTSCVAMHH